jgi:hypothetical protein
MDQPTDDTHVAEIDIACPAGTLTQAQKLPDGQDSVPAPGACTANSNIDIAITFPECLDPATNLGPHGERIAHRAIDRGSAGAHCLDGQQQIPTLQEFFTYDIPDRVGYFNAEDMTKLVEFCINGKNSLSPNCR